MSEIQVLIGPPASGKSTYADVVTKANKLWKRVNKDSIRAMINFGRWYSAQESIVMQIRDATIETLLKDGYNVIIDDTNMQQIHIDKFKELAAKYDARITYKVFDTPLEECIRRDSYRSDSAHVGEVVIRRLWDTKNIDLENFRE